MKVKFSIQKGQETEKDGMFSKKQIDMYTLTATFTPSELEKKIFNDHPLFKDMLFMEFNELDKWTTGLIFKDKHAADTTKVISVGSIYTSPTYTFRAYSVQRIVELRGLVMEAGENFANNVKVLEKLEGSDEVEFKPKE
jgi:hypothetical protein